MFWPPYTTQLLTSPWFQVKEGPYVLMSIITGDALEFRYNTSNANVMNSCLHLLRNMFDVSRRGGNGSLGRGWEQRGFYLVGNATIYPGTVYPDALIGLPRHPPGQRTPWRLSTARLMRSYPGQSHEPASSRGEATPSAQVLLRL